MAKEGKDEVFVKPKSKAKAKKKARVVIVLHGGKTIIAHDGKNNVKIRDYPEPVQVGDEIEL